MESGKYYIKHPSKFLNGTVRRLFGKWMSDEIYLKMLFRYKMDMKLNLKHPRTFSEKLQWIKINDRKPIYHSMVDKYDAKLFIDNVLGSGGGYTIPTLGVWDSFEGIDWDALPNEFILKATHDSGSYYIVKDKSKLDKQKCKQKLCACWNKDYYQLAMREWPYKGLKPRIIAEQLLHDGRGDYLTDYKFYTFNGEPKFYYVTSGRGSTEGLKEDFFDIDGNLLDLNQEGFHNNSVTPPLPQNLSTMIDFSRKLAKDTYHLRVDFYEVNGRLYCGELTFFDGGGMVKYTPDYWNLKLGDWIKLPTD